MASEADQPSAWEQRDGAQLQDIHKKQNEVGASSPATPARRSSRKDRSDSLPAIHKTDADVTAKEEAKIVDSAKSTLRVFSWTSELVATFLTEHGQEAYAEAALRNDVQGRNFLNVEGKVLIELLDCNEQKHQRQILNDFRNVRDAEVRAAPAPAANVMSKIETSRRSCVLNLNEMKLARFPDCICDIVNLNNLSMLKNRLRALPPEIGMLTKLSTLKCGRNKLSSLPDAIGHMKNLQLLSLEENELRKLPDGLMHCTLLKLLDVSMNQLALLPFGLYQCEKLTKINVYDNPLRLPKEVIRKNPPYVLKMLGGFYKGGTECQVVLNDLGLVEIPIITFEMTALTVLNLDRNSISQLDGLHLLEHLKELSFANNHVPNLPLSLAALTNLTKLNTAENPIASPPASVLQLRPDLVVRYLAARGRLMAENVEEMFRAFDTDGSGSVNRKEMMEGMHKVHLRVSKTRLQAVIAENDADGNGLIDADEFREMIFSLLEGDTKSNRVLDFSNVWMSEYEIDLLQPQNVTTLDFTCNRLRDLPADMGRFVSLQTLILDQNMFGTVPDSACLLSLRELSLRKNKLQSLPESMFGMQELAALHLDHNQFDHLPCNIVLMTGLRTLTLDRNPLREPVSQILPEGLAFLMAYLQLFYDARQNGLLDLAGMDFEYMPLESEVETLSDLLMARNRFREAPRQLALARSLLRLDLSENAMEKVSNHVMWELTTLEELRMSRNRLIELPHSIGGLTSLQVLLVDVNLVHTLPNSLSTMTALRILDLTHNRLKELPQGVAGLTALRELHVARNALIEIPEAVAGMASLQVLKARGNEIFRLADVWDQLSLTDLDLARNPIEAIPLSLGALLSSLQEIALDKHLHLDDPPDAMIARGTKPLLTYLHKQYSAVRNQQLNISSFFIANITAPLQRIDFLCGGLRTLDVSDNNIFELPRNVGMCAYLESLIIRDNRINTFPSSTKQMKTLTHLDIAGNQFTSVPELLGYTPHMRILDLSRNKIDSLYRSVNEAVAQGGFSDALLLSKRARERKQAEDKKSGRLKRTIQTHVMDRVASKIQSENRGKQVGALFQLFALEKLSVAQNTVRVLPGSISRFAGLLELDMSQNELMDVPPDIGLLTLLTSLDLSSNNLIGLPPQLGTLGRLQLLNVSNNAIQVLPNEVGDMTSLQELNFQNNAVVFLPVEFEALETNLTKLKADGNQISDPPMEVLRQGRDATFTYFRRVRNGQRSRDLVLIDMRLEQLDLNWQNLTILTALELSGNNIRQLPKAFLQLTNLVVLKVAGNNMVQVVETGDLSPLSRLTTLNLKENKIEEIEDGMGALEHLRDLNLSCNKIAKVSAYVERCTSVKKLVISENHLAELPRNLFRIADLTFFMASHNALKSLPNAMCYCLSLKEVDMSFNRLHFLPKELGSLLALEYLNLNSNLVRELPSSIKRLSALTVLCLNDNKLTTLPPEVGRLRALTSLHVRNNELYAVTPDLDKLQSLTTLEIDANEFLTLPACLKNLKALQEVRLNQHQAGNLMGVDADITPAMTTMQLSEQAVNLRKVPKDHVVDGIDTMGAFLDRIHQRESVPTLNLTHMQLKFVPSEVFTISALTVLDLKDNQISLMPEPFLLLSALTHLDISANTLSVVPPVVGSLTALTWLSLGRNKIHTLPATMEHLVSLRYLDIHVNHLTSLHPALQGPSRPSTQGTEAMGTLDDEDEEGEDALASNPIGRTESGRQVTVESAMEPAGLLLLASVRDLECSYNGLQTLPNLRGFEQVVRINVAHNTLRDIPEVICDLASLEKLEAGDNRVRLVPAAVSKLTRLSMLSLKNNNLRTLPAEIGCCTALRTLSLNANDLIAIPEEISNLRNLKRLTISANNVVDLPRDMGDMASLAKVDLSSNPIRRLPMSIGHLHEVLEVLDLFECEQLVDPPPDVVSAGHQHLMQYLRKVYRGHSTRKLVLTGMMVGKLECDFTEGKLSDLLELRVDKNQLKSVPESVGSLHKLVSLRFRDNQVVRLPDSIGQLTGLQELDMSKNRFANLPRCVLALTQLKRLRCGQNPIPYTVPSDWIEDGVASFLSNYVRDTTGRRITALWSSSHLHECFFAWYEHVRFRDDDD